MAWKLSPHPHTVYRRNPLVAVVVDVRFHPILKVADRIADFQEHLRISHPAFQRRHQQVVALQPLGGVQVLSDEAFAFSTPDGASTVTLNTTALILESQSHQTREQMLVHVARAVEALLEVYGFASPTRLGMRYVNMLDRDSISRDLAIPVEWSDLVSERFLRVPGELVDDDGAYYHAEVTAPAADGGAMTLRYGRIPDAKGDKFRFDIDRYAEQGIEMPQITTLLRSFSDDIYELFVEAMGPVLKRWMSEGGQ